MLRASPSYTADGRLANALRTPNAEACANLTNAVLEQRIARYLSSRIPDATEVSVSNLYRIPGGQSRETWSFDAAWSQAGEQAQRGFILRRDPDASVLETDREAEFRVMQAVHGRGVPIPEVLWLEQDASHLDRPFALMERLDGCEAVSYTHLRAHETRHDLVCRLLL